MLSRITTKIPGFNLLNGVAPREEIDSVIKEVKSLGKRDANNSEQCLADIDRILVLMKKYGDSLHIQRVSCHALSNLAMQVTAARHIIDRNGFELISRAIRRFTKDFKLQWLASSAIWNLARPPANRALIGRGGVTLMVEILKNHRHREKVVNTAIGALSNLSLDDDLKNMISEPAHLELILSVLKTHLQLKSMTVCTSGAGVLANIAVNDAHASDLVRHNALGFLMNLLAWDGSVDETLYRNSCAALNNMVTATGFLESFLLNRGVEKIYAFLKVYKDNELYSSLLENVLVNIDADRGTETSSLHLACHHGEDEIVRRMAQNEMDLDGKDGHGMAPLDYAIRSRSKKIVSFLCKIGANFNQITTNMDSIDPDMKNAALAGKNDLSFAKMEVQDALVEGLPNFPVDVCGFMLKFQSNVDMLKGLEMY